MASNPLGLTLHQAARQLGVSFTQENEPADKYIQINGMSLHYLEWGDAANPTVVMLHGVSQQAHSWDFISLGLSEQYRVLALDQRGHGDSDWAPDGDYSIEAHQRDIDGFVGEQGLEGFTLIGHSMGGRNGYVWASRHPGILKALVIVDTGPDALPPGRERIRRFQELPDELDSFEDFAQRVQEYTGRSREQTLGALQYTIRQRPDGKWTWKYDKLLRTPGHRVSTWTPEQLWGCLAQIASPTLVVRGGDSDLFSEAAMREMQAVIPDCATVTISRAGHLVAGDNPVDFLAAVQEMLRRVY